MVAPVLSSLVATVTQSSNGLPFSLENLKGFPLQKYTDQLETYAVYQAWYDGVPLEATTTDKNTGKVVEKYPIKINPIKGTCKRHAARVIGQNTDSIRFGGLPFKIEVDVNEEKKEIGQVVNDALMQVFTKTCFGANFLSTCIRSQYLGGAVVATKWIPEDKSIEISTPSPTEFVGIPDGSNLNRLREAWIVREITEDDAISYGYKAGSLDSKFYYIEHWTKEYYTIQVNKLILEDGPNPYGKVPVVYVPHIRVDKFLGDTIITPTIEGVIKELNIRWADIGDAVGDDSHDYVAVRNISGSVTTINVGDDRPVLDLGSTSGIGTNAEPDMFAVGTKSASEPMLKFIDELYQLYRREANHPAVADGEDEGSQRSSLTLAVRMAPLVDEAEFERLFWTVGITELCNILLTIMAVKNQYGITEEMIDLPLLLQWQPMLTRDREAFATEAAVRSKNFITSNQKLNEMFGDVRDPEQDAEQIIKEQEAIAKFTAAASPFNSQQPGSTPKSNSSGTQSKT